MRKPLLLILLILVVVPVCKFVADQSVPAAKGKASAVNSALASPIPTADFYQWFQAQGKKPASSCGPNFCTQAQRTQCAQTCRHAPFVGLQCCFESCTSFCNCGSVPVDC